MKFNIAVVGATGRIGSDILTLLGERNFPINKIFALASKKSTGSYACFKNIQISVEDLETFDFSKVQIAFFAIDDESSLKFVEIARSKGVHVIDNSSAFRMNSNSILIVPDVNGDEIDDAFSDFVNQKQKKGLLICNPNCCVIPFVTFIKSFENSGLRPIRASICSYQSVSGAGKAAMDELFANTKAKFGPGFASKEKEDSVFEYEIAFNCIPKIGEIDMKTGYTSEEQKILTEPQKILRSIKDFNDLKINATSVRVPVFVGHAFSVDIQFDSKKSDLSKLNYKDLCEIIDCNDCIDFYPNETNHIATQIDCVKRDEIFVCRLRIDKSLDNGISAFVISDNLHKGGSLNAVQIGERLIKNF